MMNLEFFYISDDFMYHWEFVLDSIDRIWDKKGISCGKAAPHSVAKESILV